MTVYNFAVMDYHTYYAGEDGVLVHNTGCRTIQTKGTDSMDGASSKSGADVIDNIITDGSHLDNGKLKPNVTYKTGEHDYIYKTNEDGLIVNASTDNLQLETHEGRLNHNSNTYGKEVGDLRPISFDVSYTTDDAFAIKKYIIKKE